MSTAKMTRLCDVGLCQNPSRPGSKFCSLGASHSVGAVVKDAATQLTAGRVTFAEFVEECKRGYVPTLRPEMNGISFVEKEALYLLRDALTAEGLRVYPAPGTPAKGLV